MLYAEWTDESNKIWLFVVLYHGPNFAERVTSESEYEVYSKSGASTDSGPVSAPSCLRLFCRHNFEDGSLARVPLGSRDL